MLEVDTLLRALRTAQPDALIVSHLGDTSNRLFATGDHPGNLYVLGAMGSVLPLALGLSLSLADDRKVVAVEGDGGCLMSLGSLATVARYGPPNLSILILDNRAYGSTGGQPSATADHTRLDLVALGAGIGTVEAFADAGAETAVSDWLQLPGLRLAVAQINSEQSRHPFVPISPTDITKRFTESVERSLTSSP